MSKHNTQVQKSGYISPSAAVESIQWLLPVLTTSSSVEIGQWLIDDESIIEEN